MKENKFNLDGSHSRSVYSLSLHNILKIFMSVCAVYEGQLFTDIDQKGRAAWGLFNVT